MSVSFQTKLRVIPPSPNTQETSSPPQRVIGPLTDHEKQNLLKEQVRKTEQAYRQFLSRPKTEDSYRDYFGEIDRLEALTRPRCVVHDLRLAERVSLYLAAKTALENPAQSPFDGKALTDPEFMKRARQVISCIDSLPAMLKKSEESLGDHLFALYDYFGKFCTAGASHAKRIDPNTNFALAKTHRNSIVLFTDALLTFVQKNNTSEKEILSSLESGEERYLLFLPILALYHLRHTSAPSLEIFHPITNELASLTVTQADIDDLYARLLDPNQESLSDAHKKGAALLSKIPSPLLNGIMGFAIGEVLKAVRARAEAPSYPLFVATLIKKEAISSVLLSNPLVPEIATLPKELQKFTPEQLAKATPGSPEHRAIQTANRILSPELFGPLPNYRLLFNGG